MLRCDPPNDRCTGLFTENFRSSIELEEEASSNSGRYDILLPLLPDGKLFRSKYYTVGVKGIRVQPMDPTGVEGGEGRHCDHGRLYGSLSNGSESKEVCKFKLLSKTIELL